MAAVQIKEVPNNRYHAMISRALIPREALNKSSLSALLVTWGASSPLRGRIFLWKKLLRPARSRLILLQPLSRRRLSRIPSRKATAAPAEIYSALP